MTTSARKRLFASTAAEVETLGAGALNKWDRKVFDAELEKSQGLKPAKNIKAPLKMFLGMEAKKEVRAKRKRETDREQGLSVKSESSFTALKKQKNSENHQTEIFKPCEQIRKNYN